MVVLVPAKVRVWNTSVNTGLHRPFALPQSLLNTHIHGSQRTGFESTLPDLWGRIEAAHFKRRGFGNLVRLLSIHIKRVHIEVDTEAGVVALEFRIIGIQVDKQAIFFYTGRDS